MKFITDQDGLTDLIAGRTSIVAFEDRLLAKWFRRTVDRGLHQITERETLRAAVRELDADLKSDPILAARRFTLRLLDPAAVAAGKRGWIDSTPSTIRAAGLLAQILPDARLVHLVRDGRDVACSFRRAPGGRTESWTGSAGGRATSKPRSSRPRRWARTGC